MNSTVENSILKQNNYTKLRYSDENANAIVVESFPALGTLTALRFIEWVQANPEGVISLPTGKTPEHFIKEVKRFLNNWAQREIQKELEKSGINPANKPSLKQLHFVQIDEFYPINPYHHNSFYYYINKYYLEEFGISTEKALLINGEKIGIPKGYNMDKIWGDMPVDLSLRHRSPKNTWENLQRDCIYRIDQWCSEYEEKIRQLGGIGFFLGGIGPDGHIGFNMRGSDHFSTTRLTEINYETQAASASDLGGIEVARKRLVITIGLATITYNPQCTAIIIAAGEAKAKIVKQAIAQRTNNLYPATALHKLDNCRFYLTQGAAKYLQQRQLEILKKADSLSSQQIEKIVINLSLEKNKEIGQLTKADFQSHPEGQILLNKSKKSPDKLSQLVKKSLENKIVKGMQVLRNKRFLHTEPHHDDIMLGYLPYVVRAIREHSNYHHFVTLTSGFTAVTNQYMLKILKKMKKALQTGLFDRLNQSDYFNPDDFHFRDRDIWKYLDGVASNNKSTKDEGMMRRMLRNLISIFDERDLHVIKARVDELINYFETQYAGNKDLPHIQKLKGYCREWESSCLWGYFGWNTASVDHLRLGFYSGEIFNEEPTINRDVKPILELLHRIKPDVVTVVFDPEASGPDTHYKVLQAIAEALKIYQAETQNNNIEVIGYRNVWYRFHPAEANLLVPVSLNMLSLMHNSFINTYLSQKAASFPSYEYPGTFSRLAQKIQVEQYEHLKTCLGKTFFFDHESALIRATRGLVYIKQMSTSEFFHFSRELKKKAENIEVKES
ncbi:MAG: glucosamine-6-phosphate deaminase [Spirochaetes bacterium]|nr:glucosamine-6-phosphate deaminase [Spirochaetota bacterium]